MSMWKVVDAKQVKRLEQMGLAIVPVASLASHREPSQAAPAAFSLPELSDDAVEAGVAAARKAVPKFGKLKDEDERAIVRAAYAGMIESIMGQAVPDDAQESPDQPPQGDPQEPPSQPQ